MYKCIQCHTANAVWIRSTQFAGKHPYCDEHAKLEEDFGENDSYQHWIKLDEHDKN